MNRRRSMWMAPFAALLCVVAPAPASALEFDDATVLALDLSGALLPPPDLVAHLDADLAAIRAIEPLVREIHARPNYVPGVLIIRLTPAAFDEVVAGNYHGFDALNATYGPASIRTLIESLQYIKIVFEKPYNAPLLAPAYGTAEGVIYAGADGPLSDGDDIHTDVVGTYTFRKGWNDCSAGCLSKHFWVFSVEDGEVTLIDEYGSPLPTAVSRSTWGALKQIYR